MPCIRKYFFLIIIIIGLFQMRYLNFDYPFIGGDFSLHHDEKLAIPDARYYFLKNTEQISLLDYQPYPPSAMYGIAGPAIIDLGFKIFGMNNFGLRFFFVIVTAVTSLLCVSLILRVAPGSAGLFFSAIYVFSYANIMLGRHAVLENFLTFFLMAILWSYFAKPNIFLNNLYIICFLAGISVLFKANFVFYVCLLLFVIVFIEVKGFKERAKVILWSLFSVSVFELFQVSVLSRMGLAHLRYPSLLTVFFHSQGLTNVESLRPLSIARPMGIEIFSVFPVSLCGWYGIPKAIFYKVYYLYLITGCLFASVLISSIFWGSRRMILKGGLVTALFITGYLLFSSSFFYYTKRGVSFFPFTIILLALLLHEGMQRFLKSSAEIHKIAKGVLIFIAIAYSVFQVATLVQMSTKKSDLVERNSLALDNDLPKGSVIYAHTFGYRFFWMSKWQRLLSGDDVFFSNAMILARALKGHERYLLLSGRSDALYLWLKKGPDKAFCSWFERNAGGYFGRIERHISGKINPGPKISEVLQEVKALKILKTYYTTETESGTADQYTLMEVIYN